MKFKKHIFICTNDRGEESARKSCGSCGGMNLRKELVKMINDNGLKGKVRANKSGCLDVCEHGPALVVYPAGHWYLEVKKENLKRIFDTSILNSEPAPELIADNSQLESN